MGVGIWVWALVGALALATPAMAADPLSSDPFFLCTGHVSPTAPAEDLDDVMIDAVGALVNQALHRPPSASAKPAVGEAGVAACDAALRLMRTPVPHAELSLAQAIHRLEMKDYAGALAEARAAPGMAGARADEPGFRRSLGARALNIEAVALVGLDRPEEAEATVLRMAQAAPFDPDLQRRAQAFLTDAGRVSPAGRAYFAVVARLDAQQLYYLVGADVTAGDYADADRQLALLEQHDGLFDPGDPLRPGFLAYRALAAALAGDVARSDALAARARAGLAPAGDGAAPPPSARQAIGLLALRDAVALLAEGRAAEARAAFAATGAVPYAPGPLVLDVLQRLRRDAPPEALTGPLAVDPQALRAREAAAGRKRILDPAHIAELLPSLTYEAPGAFRPLLQRVWSDDPKALVVKPAQDPGVTAPRPGDFYGVRDFRQDLAFQALLLHAAVIARARGHAVFALGAVAPGNGDGAFLWTRSSAPGAAGFAPETSLRTDDVIAALEARMPPPKAR